jgi:hypothetical protein
MPDSNLSLKCCQRNRPVAVSKHMSTLLSSGSVLPSRRWRVSWGLRGLPLLVPTYTLRPATTGWA